MRYVLLTVAMILLAIVFAALVLVLATASDVKQPTRPIDDGSPSEEVIEAAMDADRSSDDVLEERFETDAR